MRSQLMELFVEHPELSKRDKILLNVLVVMTAVECLIFGLALQPIRWSQWLGFGVFMLASCSAFYRSQRRTRIVVTALAIGAVLDIAAIAVAVARH